MGDGPCRPSAASRPFFQHPYTGLPQSICRLLSPSDRVRFRRFSICHLTRYIKNPAAKIPETKMIFPGIKNEQQAKDLWAYISQFDADGNLKK